MPGDLVRPLLLGEDLGDDARAALQAAAADEQALVKALDGEDRRWVSFQSTIHYVRQVTEGLQVNLSLKFTYDRELITEIFGRDATQIDWQARSVEGGSIIPYMIVNAMDTNQVSWSGREFSEEVKNERRGDEPVQVQRVEERIGLVVILSSVSYNRYFPWELLLMFLTIQMDGTRGSKRVNLMPHGEGCRAGFFSKETSPLTLADRERDSTCRMYLRDARSTQERERDQRNNTGEPKLETSVVISFLFRSDGWENLWKYIGVSCCVGLLALFLPAMEINDMVQTALAMILAIVGLLYVMPSNDEFTTAERVLTAQIIGVVFMTVWLGVNKAYGLDGFQPGDEVHDGLKRWWALPVGGIFASGGFVYWETQKYTAKAKEVQEGLTYDVFNEKHTFSIGLFSKIRDKF